MAVLSDEQARRLAADKVATPIRYFNPRSGAVGFFTDTRTVSALRGPMRSSKSMSMAARIGMGMTGIESVHTPGALDAIYGRLGLSGPPLDCRIWCEDLTRVGRNVLLPLFHRLIPPSMLDESNGVGGFNRETNTLRLTNRSFVEFMSYNLPPQKGAAASRHIVGFDELPPMRLFTSQWARILDTGGFLWIAATIDALRTTRNLAWFDRMVQRGSRKVFGLYTLSTEENMRRVAEERGTKSLQVMKEMRAVLPQEEVDVMLDGTAGVTMGQIYKRYDERQHTYSGLSADDFCTLRDKGYGDFWCGMDHGGAHATVVVYVFIATHPAPSLKLVEGDYVQVWEYYKAGSNVPSHIPRLKALHDKFKPKAYFCDPHMWDDDAKQPGRTVALDYGAAGIAPMYRGNNQVDPGIQAVDRMLMVREGDFSWPRYRLLARCNRHTEDGFRIWSTKVDAIERSGADKYSEVEKDQMDAVRYLVRAAPERRGEPMGMVEAPVDPFTNVPLELFFSLDGVGVAL